MELKVKIKVFEGRMDAKSLDTWIQALEVYFSCQAYTNEQRVMFSRLKMRQKSLLWWEYFCKIKDQKGQAQVTSWNEFKKKLRKNFYPLGYEYHFFLKWHHLKKGQGQSIEYFYEEYQDLIIRLDIQELTDKMILKFIGGLHGYIRHELEMFPLPSLQEAFRLTSKIEARRKASTKEERKPKRRVSLISDTSSSSSSSSSSGSSGKRKKKGTRKKISFPWRKKQDDSRTCSYCGKKGHDKEGC